MITTINPYTLLPIESFETIPNETIDEKITQANETYRKWRASSFEYRGDLMLRLANEMMSSINEIASVMTIEMGKPLEQSIAEVRKCAWVCEYYASNADHFLKDYEVNTEASRSWVRYDSMGIIFGIMPWNFPFWQVMRFAAPTLMAGNVVMIKHAPNSMGSAHLIQTLFEKAGFPRGIYTNLVIEVSQVEHVIANPNVKAVTLTGSERAGTSVASLAGKYLKKCVLELGGSNAFVVLADADLNAAVKIGLDARMLNNGQSCIAAKRFLIHRSIANHYIELFIKTAKEYAVGDPLSSKTQLGPLARIDLAETLSRQIASSVEQGAELAIGGCRQDALFEPTVLLGVKEGMTAFEQELFGPVAAFTIFDELEEAIHLSNLNNYGLGVSFCTQNSEQILPYLSTIEDGAVFINEKVMSDPRLPFGGTKKSGFGRELGMHGIHEFVNTKTVYIK